MQKFLFVALPAGALAAAILVFALVLRRERADSLVVVAQGRQVLGVSCEDYRRHGAFPEYVAVPQHNLYREPDYVSINQAAKVEPNSVSLHALNLNPLQLHD